MGSISKRERMSEVSLERRTLNRQDSLILKRGLCIGCGLCAEVCPKDALSVSPAAMNDGHLSYSPIVDIDEKKCIMCGICVVICPLNAFVAKVNDRQVAMFVENEAIPDIIRRINVDKELCKTDCGLKCEESCPRNAIKLIVEKENGHIKKINDVQVLSDLCIYCKACQYACPYGSIVVEKPFEGSIIVEKEKCPQACRICAEICPSRAITFKGNGLDVKKELCIFCKVCQNVCPVGAVHIDIDRVSHAPIKSATWTNILERFASYKTATKELDAKSRHKQKSIIQNRIH